ncbi:hypothetical protein SteCoe_30695 [Stentor coeruleus]|uniref:LITAF domain-containing protein n=1 Tax=Stentor coeruleus TaxID=5963 RepID=A0A1R2B2Z7_9CILI|nr:hypothetical protein SteCoe_30695 [Stentor coeruleus]
MSLEMNINLALIDEKNPLDTSSSVNMLSNSILTRGLDDIYSPYASNEKYILGTPLDTQKSSQFSDLYASHASCEYKTISFTEEMEKTPNEHNQQCSVVEKSAINNYKIMLESLPESMRTISDLSFDENAIPIPVNRKEIRASTIYTNLSSDSSHIHTEPASPHVLEDSKRDNMPEIAKSKIKQNLITRPTASIRNSTFALTNRIFCMKCNTETYTNVSFQMKDMNLWGSIGFFFTAIKCCGEPRALSRYQDIVHSCKKCGSIVARISTV